jgi:hypothetical protein
MVLENKYSEIKVGSKVIFSVENPSQWIGSNEGILRHDGSEFYIETKNGIVTINKGYDAYLNTIRCVN